MLIRYVTAWFGHFDRDELVKFILLSAVFFLIIGTYWFLNITKDAVFQKMVGWDLQPYAKMASGAAALPLVLGYGMLADYFPRQRVLYVVASVYALLAAIFYTILIHPEFGMANTVQSVYRVTGWTYFVFVESFGSIMAGIFWALAADITKPESAKRGYFIIALFGQAGAIFFARGVEQYAERLGTAPLLGYAVWLIALIPVATYTALYLIPSHTLAGYKQEDATQLYNEKPRRPRVGESIRLLLHEPYLLGIFGVIGFFDIIITMFEFRFKSIASQTLAGEQFTRYIASFGVWVNIVAFISLLAGINNIGRRLGLKVSLVILPVLVGASSLVLWYHGTLQAAFWVMVSAKALNYALNHPTKEQLYIPTSYDAKYKSKVFIDMFGSRASKGIGSLINSYNTVFYSETFALLSTAIALGLSGAWIFVALYLGDRHKKAIENNEYVC